MRQQSCRLPPSCQRPFRNPRCLHRLYFPRHKRRILFCLGNRVFEIIIILLRAQGLNEADAAKFFTEEDIRITLAKQYINDNIEHLFNCDEIAKYCYLSKKQMTRLFRQCDGISPLEYINNQKVSYIEKLLIDTPLSLKEISEKMNFSSEYYFSAFFKKHSGMPPGAYRKMYK